MPDPISQRKRGRQGAAQRKSSRKSGQSLTPPAFGLTAGSAEAAVAGATAQAKAAPGNVNPGAVQAPVQAKPAPGQAPVQAKMANGQGNKPVQAKQGQAESEKQGQQSEKQGQQGGKEAAQAKFGGQGVLQAKGPIHVPEIDDPAAIPDMEGEHKYQWQNEHLYDDIYDRDDTEYNDREIALRGFLEMFRELELSDHFKEGTEEIPMDKQLEMIEEDRVEIQKEKDENLTAKNKNLSRLAELETDIPDMYNAYRAARSKRGKARRKSAEDQVGREQILEHDELKEAIEKKEKREKFLKGNINYIKRTSWKYKTQEDMDNAIAGWQGKLDKVTADLTKLRTDRSTLQTAMEAHGSWKTLTAPEENYQTWQNLKAERSQLRKSNKGLDKEVTRLDKELANLPTLGKEGNFKPKEVFNWKMNRYRKKLNGMDHMALIEELKVQFEKDGDMTKIPEWARYLIVHYSGMRYKSAHGSYQSPRNLLKVMKDHEVANASGEEALDMKGQGMEVLDNDPTFSGFDEKTAKSLRKQQAATSEAAVMKTLPKKDKQHYPAVKAIEGQIELQYRLLRSAGDPATAEKYMAQIDNLEQEIQDQKENFSNRGWKKVQSARSKREQFLMNLYAAQSKSKIDALSDSQAVYILQQLRKQGYIPDQVWQELAAYTQIRVNEGDDWAAGKKGRGLKGEEGKDAQEQALLDAWKPILSKKQFYQNATLWRKYHGETLSPNIVTRLVCDQLGTHAQHLRGIYRGNRGLKGNAEAYVEMEKEAGGTPDGLVPDGSSPFFRRFNGDMDMLKPGASLFWAGWNEIGHSDEWLTAEAELSETNKKIKSLERKLKRKKIKEEDKKKWESGLYELMQIKEQQEQIKGNTMEWDGSKAKLPNIANVLTPEGGDMANIKDEKGRPITDGVIYDGWKYRIEEKKYNGKLTKSVMRVKKNPYHVARGQDIPINFNTSFDKRLLKQHMKWKHEATVMYATDKYAITFDTSNTYNKKSYKGLGARKRSKGQLDSSANLFVGYAPQATSKQDISKFLEDI